MALRVEVVNHLTEHLLTLIAIPGSHIHAFQEIFLGQVVLGRKLHGHSVLQGNCLQHRDGKSSLVTQLYLSIIEWIRVIGADPKLAALT